MSYQNYNLATFFRETLVPSAESAALKLHTVLVRNQDRTCLIKNLDTIIQDVTPCLNALVKKKSHGCLGKGRQMHMYMW